MPVGTYKIRAKAIGYKSVVKDVTTIAGTTVEVKFQVEEDVFNVDEVVVSADRNQTNRAEAPVVITSISPKVLEKTQSVNIAEGLCFTPGLRTECNCQNCGFTQLRMNGMEGPYTQILMNSRPVFSGLAGVYGLELIPTNMVERLEVVRGGGSALFGGNAIAGTVNIITKEPNRNSFSLDTRYASIGVGSTHHGYTASPTHDGQVSFNASIVSDDNKSGGYIYAMLRDRGAHDENGDGFSESVLMKNTTFGFNVYYKPTIKTKISLDAYKVNEFRRGGNKFDYLPHETDITEQLTHNIIGSNLAFDLFTNAKYDKLTIYGALQQVERDSYYGAEQDPNAYGSTDDLSASFGAQYVINSDNFLFSPATTVFGVEHNMNELDDNKLGADGAPNFQLTNQRVSTTGAFVQQDWKSEKFNASLGLRYDHYLVKDLKTDATKSDDVEGDVFLPRVSLMYKITPDVRFRVGYAQGYRAPQIFNEDLHIELIGAKRIERINDKDLKQETSHAFTASLNTDLITGTVVHNLLMEGFYTQLVNPFADEFDVIEGAEDEDHYYYKRINAEDGAHVAGVNLEYQTMFSSAFSTSLGLTIQKSEFAEEQGWGDAEGSVSKHFMRTPDVYGYFTADWHVTKAFSADLAINYTGSMYVPHFGYDPDDAETTPAHLAAIKRGDIIAGERLEESEDFIIVDLLL
ncbi:MAG: TonB-dependent receptor, partial [Draconibacterium sp.]